jgi:hypothetical protein
MIACRIEDQPGPSLAVANGGTTALLLSAGMPWA